MTLCITYFLYNYLNHTILPQPILAKKYIDTAIIFLISGSTITCLMTYWNQPKAIIILLLTSFIFLLYMLAAVPFMDNRTILPLARTLKPILRPQDVVITFNQYYQDLPFYLEQPVTILNWRNELSYGMKHQKHHEWMINDTIFWQYWHHTQCVFVVIDKKEYEKIQLLHPKEIFYPLQTTTSNILISNCNVSIN